MMQIQSVIITSIADRRRDRLCRNRAVPHHSRSELLPRQQCEQVRLLFPEKKQLNIVPVFIFELFVAFK